MHQASLDDKSSLDALQEITPQQLDTDCHDAPTAQILETRDHVRQLLAVLDEKVEGNYRTSPIQIPSETTALAIVPKPNTETMTPCQDVSMAPISWRKRRLILKTIKHPDLRALLFEHAQSMTASTIKIMSTLDEAFTDVSRIADEYDLPDAQAQLSRITAKIIKYVVRDVPALKPSLMSWSDIFIASIGGYQWKAMNEHVSALYYRIRECTKDEKTNTHLLKAVLGFWETLYENFNNPKRIQVQIGHGIDSFSMSILLWGVKNLHNVAENSTDEEIGIKLANLIGKYEFTTHPDSPIALPDWINTPVLNRLFGYCTTDEIKKLSITNIESLVNVALGDERVWRSYDSLLPEKKRELIAKLLAEGNITIGDVFVIPNLE